MSTKDGGPAFAGASGSDGMSLRDWFAGQAAASVLGGLQAAGVSTGTDDASAIATASYRLADAMLKARESSHA